MTTINDWPYLVMVQALADQFGFTAVFREQHFFGTHKVYLEIKDDGGTYDKLSFVSYINPQTKRINNGAHLWSMGAGVGTPITLKKAMEKLQVWDVSRTYRAARK